MFLSTLKLSACGLFDLKYHILFIFLIPLTYNPLAMSSFYYSITCCLYSFFYYSRNLVCMFSLTTITLFLCSVLATVEISCLYSALTTVETYCLYSALTTVETPCLCLV